MVERLNAFHTSEAKYLALIEKAAATPNAQITVRAGPEPRRLLKSAVLRHLAP